MKALGLTIYGSPWHLKRGCLYHVEAFAKPTNELERIFGNIPLDTDIMISHVPPCGLRDLNNSRHIGSDSLLKNMKRVNPILHVFGHIHQQWGVARHSIHCHKSAHVWYHFRGSRFIRPCRRWQWSSDWGGISRIGLVTLHQKFICCFTAFILLLLHVFKRCHFCIVSKREIIFCMVSQASLVHVNITE